jgi:hypothetical protein
MASFDCRTPGCTGRITFADAGEGEDQGRLDQLTGQRLDPSQDKPVECPVCHVVWRERQLRGDGAGARPP